MRNIHMSRQSLSSILLITTVCLNICVEGGSISRSAGEVINWISAQLSHSRVKHNMPWTNISQRTNVDIVFSDLDGTLIHYPKNLTSFLQRNVTGDICVLPSSSTGMVGVISAKSLKLVREIRTSGAIFVLVSGMRSSTLLKRLPYLPKADAYCCEAGGRIFYPTLPQSIATFRVFPKRFHEASFEDMQPFSLVEDMEWREQMEQESAAGIDGFIGKEVNFRDGQNVEEISISERKGFLWDFARFLLEKGFTVDATGYCTCFRVNRNQQSDAALFDALINSDIKVPSGLAFSTNLGCIDFYPTLSGKKNCCDFLRKKFAHNTDRVIRICLCLCDDDNDIEMAQSCSHAYLPLVSSASMEDCIRSFPANFSVISWSKDSDDGIEATEKALDLVLKRLNSM